MTDQTPPSPKIMLAVTYAEKATSKIVPVDVLDTWWGTYGPGTVWAHVRYENSDGTIREHSIEEYEYDFYRTLVTTYVESLDD